MLWAVKFYSTAGFGVLNFTGLDCWAVFVCWLCDNSCVCYLLATCIYSLPANNWHEKISFQVGLGTKTHCHWATVFTYLRTI